jgi:hypothetical protein
MSQVLAQKTFKVELEFTVQMHELEEHKPGDRYPGSRMHFLKQLQKALLKDEPALLRQMVAALLNKLQDYADYLAAQNNLLSLKKAADSMNPADRAYQDDTFETFGDLTRAVRISAMDARLEHSTIQEKSTCGDCSPDRPVWEDLRQGTEYGKLLAKFVNPATQPSFGLAASHFLMVRYLTRQVDGVHCEARCTCDTVLEGIGPDEASAIDALWMQYKQHTAFTGLHKRLKSGLKRLFSKN